LFGEVATQVPNHQYQIVSHAAGEDKGSGQMQEKQEIGNILQKNHLLSGSVYAGTGSGTDRDRYRCQIYKLI
jgi:hypothetical protein